MDVPESGKKFGKTIPVIIENHKNGIKKTKIMVPSHYTASQLLNILRLKTHMNPHHPLYLFLKAKHRPLLMSKCIGHLHQKYRDEKGCLHLIQADQSTFGFRGNIRAIRFRQKWIESYPNEAPILTSFIWKDPGLPSEISQFPPSAGLFINPILNEIQLNPLPNLADQVIGFNELNPPLTPPQLPFDTIPETEDFDSENEIDFELEFTSDTFFIDQVNMVHALLYS
ncbi:map1lc3b [Nephila pilipes]|uniref:Map1lc3b n=1 Tax=Nephila pilipes TaxID=299642 RepID=A0A8X6QZD8_NEPPI|nr:map1lc3b [Nephila pilipes]